MKPVKKPIKRAMPAVEGDAAPRRADRPAYRRGGAVKHKGGSTVNIVIAGQGTPGGAPGPAGPGLPPAVGPVPAALAPKPMMPPPPGLAGAGGPPPGPPMARGGRMTAGAGTGMGRLQKARSCK